MVETTHTPHTAPGTHSVGASPLRTLSSSSSSSSPYGVERADAPRELHGIKSPSLAVSTTPYYGSRTPSSFSPSAMSASTPLNPGTSPFRLRTPSTPYNSNNNGITINGNSSSSSGSNGADTGTGIAMSSPGIAHSDSGKPAMYESPLSRPSSAFSLSLGSPSFHSATPTLTLSHGLTNGQGQAQGQGQGQGHTRESLKVDTERILTGLGLKSSSADKTVAARELRHLVRTADDTYWAEYCPQVRWLSYHLITLFCPLFIFCFTILSSSSLFLYFYYTVLYPLPLTNHSSSSPLLLLNGNRLSQSF
jgi:hypothetical protein